MPRPIRIAALALGAWLLGAGGRAALAAEDFVFHHENVMGTSLELRVRADSAGAASRAEGRALREIDRLSKIFSGYDPESEFSRWQAAPGGPAKVSPELVEVLRASDRWRERSGGAFDPRVEALTRLWSRRAREGRPPSPAEVAEARSLMARPAWQIDADGRAERLTDGPLTLNAIAKGYIVERACEVALAKGEITGALLNVGGDLRARGEVAGTIGIANPAADSETSEPLAYIEVKDRSVATSGNYRRGFQINGRRYSHIFDPRTGEPADRVSGATVVADRGADADALATALNVLPPEEGLRLVESLPGAECLIIAADGRVSRSAGWQHFERPALALADGREAAASQKAEEKGKDKAKDKGKAEAPAKGSWGDEYELVVNFEINRPDESARYRRPYVAIWVENKDGFSVRTLALWVSLGGAGPERWLPDLKRWYRSDRARKRIDKTERFLVMARATRPPGKYDVIWDGRNDDDQPLPPGEYTLYIEAAREHGTYQSIRKDITVGAEPFSEELKGNVEIKSASIEYRRKPPAK